VSIEYNLDSCRFFFTLTNAYSFSKNFPSDQYRSYEESLRNVSLVIQNSHFSFSYPRPLLPNMVEAGGLQVKSKPSPLPIDLKNFLDKANDGAILFTLGSILKSNELPKSTVEILLKVFGKIKQRIVMKWESDELPGKPQNVFISKWLPQDDVLAHPNIKAFISHCGPNGIYEARYNSVVRKIEIIKNSISIFQQIFLFQPIIGIPHFAEHLGYLRLIVQEGWAIELDQDTLIEEILENAIKEILTNPKYLQIVQKSSTLVKDRPLNAQDTAAFWVEYVIRHHGAPHLHYPGADQNLLQKNSIDVIAFILAIIYAVFKVFKLIFKRLCCHKKSNISVKEKRN
jgi:glucuronosyltransferase